MTNGDEPVTTCVCPESPIQDSAPPASRRVIVRIAEKPDGWFLEIALDRAWATEQTRKPVTTELLGRTAMTGLAFENADGSPLRVNMDYFGNRRSGDNPFPGPFAAPPDGKQTLKVWPRGTP